MTRALMCCGIEKISSNQYCIFSVIKKVILWHENVALNSPKKNHFLAILVKDSKTE